MRVSEQGRRRERKCGRRESGYIVLCHELAVSVMCVHVGIHGGVYTWEGEGVVHAGRFSHGSLPLLVHWVCSEMSAEGFLRKQTNKHNGLG